MKKIVIAGGTGLIGQKLEKQLAASGHEVFILTRSPKENNHIYWNPANGEISKDKLEKIDVIVNLTGAGIADKRWSESRKKVLYDSRINTTDFLFEHLDDFPNAKQYVTASGINCYGYDSIGREFVERDPFGSDYLSSLVKSWEEHADQFSKKGISVSKIRISMVLSDRGGALDRLKKIAKIGLASPLGSGKQEMTWIHETDLVRLFDHVISNELSGAWNALNDYSPNATFMKTLANRFNKSMWMPKVPAFVMKLVFGEMSEMLLKGVPVSNQAIKETGFQFNYSNLEEAFASLDL